MEGKREVIFYTKDNGISPVEKWLKGLDKNNERRIRSRLLRVEQGNFGDHKVIKVEGFHELRFSFGPGYRLYYAEIDKVVVVLLQGGDKNTQNKDIKLAKEYLEDFKRA